MPSIDLVLDAHATIAESLLWEPEQARLYWADIKAPALYRLDPQSLRCESWSLPADIGAFALTPGSHGAVVALRTGLSRLTFASRSLSPLASPPYDPNLLRFNDGICDAAGRFWIGTMFDPLQGFEDREQITGPLSSWNGAEGLRVHADTSALHNGMAWNADGSQFYVSHSYERTVYAYRMESGSLRERRTFARVEAAEGIPDGAAVDEEGAYWCALHGGSRVLRFSPEGLLLTEVELPVSQPTMCAFGGPDLRTLFISSASDQLSPSQLEREPHAGSIFRYEPGVRGLPRACHVT